MPQVKVLIVLLNPIISTATTKGPALKHAVGPVGGGVWRGGRLSHCGSYAGFKSFSLLKDVSALEALIDKVRNILSVITNSLSFISF